MKISLCTFNIIKVFNEIRHSSSCLCYEKMIQHHGSKWFHVKKLIFSYQVIPRIFCTKSMSSSGTPQFCKIGKAVAMTNKNFASPNRSSKWESRSKHRFHLAGFEFLNAKSLRGTTMAQSGWGIVESSSTFSFLGWWRRNMRHSGSWIAAFGKRHSYSREKKGKKLALISNDTEKTLNRR